MNNTDIIKLASRRYIGSKAKLIGWIFDIIDNTTDNVHTFCDIFAGTGVIADAALSKYEYVIMNDLLYSNNIIYKAFLAQGEWDKEKITSFLNKYNALDSCQLEDNYFLTLTMRHPVRLLRFPGHSVAA